MSEERRRRARIAIQLPCRLKGPGSAAEGEILDVSTIGAKVVTKARTANDDDEVLLTAEGLEVAGRIMYARERDGQIVNGVQFAAMDADAYRVVEAFVAALMEGDGGGKREHPRVQHRVQVVCRTSKRAKGMLQDISKGGMRVLVEDVVNVGDDLTAEITVGKLEKKLVLTGKVVRVKSDDAGEKHLAGVKIGDIPDDMRALLDKLLAMIMES